MTGPTVRAICCTGRRLKNAICAPATKNGLPVQADHFVNIIVILQQNIFGRFLVMTAMSGLFILLFQIVPGSDYSSYLEERRALP